MFEVNLEQAKQITGMPVQQINEGLSDKGGEDSLFVVRSGGSTIPYQVEIKVDGQPLTMVVDTGASWLFVLETTC